MSLPAAAGTRHATALSEFPGNTGVNSDSAPHNRAKPSEPLLTLDESKRIALARYQTFCRNIKTKTLGELLSEKIYSQF